MIVSLKIFRFNPEVDKKWHYETYSLEAAETDRVDRCRHLLPRVGGVHQYSLHAVGGNGRPGVD